MINIPKTKFNIFIIGDSQVGKTSIMKVFRDLDFNPKELPSIGLDSFIETIKFNDLDYKFKFFDISGREKFRSIAFPKFKLADGFIYIFSVDNTESLKHIDYWLHLVDDLVQLKKMKILLGNKIDVEIRQIDNEKAVNFAKEKKMKYYEVSAKTGFKVKESIEDFCKEIYKEYKQFENKSEKISKNK